jgi:Ty3 transposon capsid-like protein
MNSYLMDTDGEESPGPGGLAPTPVDETVFSIPQTVWNEKLRELEELRQTLKTQNENIAQLTSAVASVTTALAAATTRPTLPSPAKRHAKIAPPEKFSGRKDKLHEFLAKCQQQFLNEPECFTTDAQKTLWTGTYLEDSAYNWFRSIFSAYAANPHSPPPEFASYAKFEESLKAAFGDPDETAFHERKLNNLKQHGSAVAYASQFRVHQGFVEWNDKALASAFRTGLKPSVKDALIYEHPPPKTLEALIEAATRIDSRIYERELERKLETGERRSGGTKTNQRTNATPAPISTYRSNPTPVRTAPIADGDGSTPMELDSSYTPTPRGPKPPLSNDERQRRWKLGLCSYCGAGDHKTHLCPRLATKFAYDRAMGTSTHSSTSSTPARGHEMQLIDLGTDDNQDPTN